MQETDRTRRLSELVKRELARLIPRELDDERINSVTVTAVTVSRDLRQSTVYVVTRDPDADPGTVERLMNRSAGYLRRLLGREVNLRVTPALTFRYDRSIDHGMRLSSLIESLNRDDG